MAGAICTTFSSSALWRWGHGMHINLKFVLNCMKTHTVLPWFSLDGWQGPSRIWFSSNFCKPRLFSIVMLVCYYCYGSFFWTENCMGCPVIKALLIREKYVQETSAQEGSCYCSCKWFTPSDRYYLSLVYYKVLPNQRQVIWIGGSIDWFLASVNLRSFLYMLIKISYNTWSYSHSQKSADFVRLPLISLPVCKFCLKDSSSSALF
jgi:hypothetical protein